MRKIKVVVLVVVAAINKEWVKEKDGGDMALGYYVTLVDYINSVYATSDWVEGRKILVSRWISSP